MLVERQSDRQRDQGVDSLVPYSKGMHVVVDDVVVVILVSYAIMSLITGPGKNQAMVI